MFLNHFRSISYLILVILVNFENNSFQITIYQQYLT